ncbi:MAG: hypothetical protein HN390_00300, partial [Anaerolineae bacterium]|nr:hypothetical protein [Anaerolineae bacterium]
MARSKEEYRKGIKEDLDPRQHFSSYKEFDDFMIEICSASGENGKMDIKNKTL